MDVLWYGLISRPRRIVAVRSDEETELHFCGYTVCVLSCPVHYPLLVHPLCNVVVSSASDSPNLVSRAAKVFDGMPMKLVQVTQKAPQTAANQNVWLGALGFRSQTSR